MDWKFLTNTIHLGNSIGEEARESTSHGRGGEEETLAQSHLRGAVPHGEVVCDTRIETSLSDSKEDTDDQETSIVINDAEADRAGSPGDHNRWQPYRGSELLEEEVGWDFKCAVGEKEDS